MADKNTPLVAFIGLGSMGMGMAKNLLKGGHKVIGVDPVAATREAFTAAGGTVAASPGEAAASADVVVVVAQVPAPAAMGPAAPTHLVTVIAEGAVAAPPLST